MIGERLEERVARNRAALTSPRQRRLLALLIPLFYVITVVARLVDGAGFPASLWSFGYRTASFVSALVVVIVVIAVHWLLFGRDRRQRG